MYTDLKLSHDDRGTWNKAGILRVMNAPEAENVIIDKGEELIKIAKSLWNQRRRGESDPPIYYGESFGWRYKKLYGMPAVEAGNSDPRWFFVEFGVGHGAGKPGYKYRILGSALDILSGGAGDKVDYEWSNSPTQMEFQGFVEEE